MRSFAAAVAPVVLLAVTAAASPSDGCKSLSAGSAPAVKARCAQQIAAAACRTRSGGRVTSILSKKLGVPAGQLTEALRRFRVGPGKAWCGLTVAQMSQILATADRPKRGEKASEHRQEWIRFTLGDENGYIRPDGLARALEERKALVGARGPNGRRVAVDTASLPSTPAGWTSLNGYTHPVGRVNDLLIHPTSTNTMWAGTDGGGIFKTTDGGTTWQATNDFYPSLSISSFAMRTGDPSTIYAGTGPMGSHTGLPGAGVLKSVDGGNTWSLLPSTSPTVDEAWRFVYQLAIDPTNSNTVIAATWLGAYITINGGTDWTEIAAAAVETDAVAIHPSNANLRVIAMHDGTVRIATDGATYNSYTIASSTASYTRIALAPSNQNVMYALVWDSGTTTLYRSATGGTSWLPVTTPSPGILRGQLFYTGGLWVDPTNANHIAVSEFWAGVTSDASVPSPAWTTSSYGWVDFHGIVNDPGYNGTSRKTVYFFDDGGLYRWNDVDAIDSEAPAFLSPNGIVATEVYTAAGRGGNVIFGAQDVASRYYRTSFDEPATQRWRFALGLGGHDGAATAADSTNPSILYGSTQFLGIHRSTDGGANTAFICQGIIDINCGGYFGNASFIAPFVLDPNNQNRMLAGAASLWRSENVSSGSPPTWTAIHSGAGSTVSAIAIAPSDSNVVWAAYQNGTVFKTANGTAASPVWTQVANVPVGNKLRIYIDRTNSQRVYIGLAGFEANRLVTTPDAGANWSNVTGLPAASVFAVQQHPANSSWLYVGTAVGLFASMDSGATWSGTNEGPANVQVRDLNWYSDSPAVLLVATFGRGVWRATVSSSLAAPTNLIATAATATNVGLTWNAVAAATSYKIFRSSAYPAFTQIGTTSNASYSDTTATAGMSYLYKVQASDGSIDSTDSNVDLATTVLFTDEPLVAGTTVVKAAHATELRTAVNATRALAGLAASTFTDDTLSSTISVKRVHVIELRSALDAARSAMALTAITYSDVTINVGATTVKASHVDDLRQGVR